MPQNEQVIQIDSITGGQSELAYFGASGQFKASYAIDQDQPASDTGSQGLKPSGFLRPTGAQKIDSSTTFAGAPMHLVPNPKDDKIYVIDTTASTYTLNPSDYSLSALSDAGEFSNGSGNGGEYYDNYIYNVLDTTVARYGPLNGTQAFNGNFWASTLGKSALSNTTYPTHANSNHPYPNHPIHRHSDGRLYFGDVVDNQGYLHYIATKKTSVEGDTDNSSTEQALDFGFGEYPIAIETYEDRLAVSLYEGSNDTATFQKRAKLIFWDTVAASPNKVISVELPDPIITALKNVNGVLYTFSGQLGARGTRVCAFVGGYSFQQVAYIPDSVPPFAGAVDHVLNKALFGGTATDVNDGTSLPCVWANGSTTGKFSGVYNVMGCSNSSSSAEITSMAVVDQNDGFGFQIPITGHSDGSNFGVDRQTTDYSRHNQIWRSETFRIGQPFKVTKIRLPFAQAIGSNMTVVPKLFFDEQSDSKTLVTINNTNYPNSEKNVVIRPDSATGQHSFFLELTWSGSALATVGFPIQIYYQPLNDDQG